MSSIHYWFCILLVLSIVFVAVKNENTTAVSNSKSDILNRKQLKTLPSLEEAANNLSKLLTHAGFPLELSCDSNGMPIVNCFWDRLGLKKTSFNMKYLDSSDDASYISAGFDLEQGYCGIKIISVVLSDNATWVCTLQGKDFYRHGYVNLKVLDCYGKSCTDCSQNAAGIELCTKYQPRIIQDNLLESFHEHTDNLLTCRTPVLPLNFTTRIEWWRNNQMILSNEGINMGNGVEETLTLPLKNLSIGDAGEYTCFVENPLNRTKGAFIVNIRQDEDIGDIQNRKVLNGPVIAIAIAVALISLIIFGIIINECCKYRTRDKGVLSKEEMKIFRLGNPDMQGLGLDETYGLGNIENMPYDQIFEIHRSRFNWEPTAVLGKGAFGIVYKGTYLDRPVAVKTILETSVDKRTETKVYTRALLSEIKVMCYLSAPENTDHIGKSNILTLIGANTKDIRKGLFLLSEFCELGSLEGYLRKHRQQFQQIVLPSNPDKDDQIKSPEKFVISTVDLTRWAYEIANGMAYISNQNIIHLDLATRNVLLNNARLAKISDFGLSRRLYEYRTYIKQNQEPLPWRWMAIESLKDLKFSSESDVWSYGITVWEIFSLAEIPYPGLTWTIDFVNILEQGVRPAQPKFACAHVYNVMEQTWLVNPAERWNFEQIRIEMRTVLEEYTGQNYASLKPMDIV